MAALARASHTKEPGILRGPDHIAQRFLGPGFRFIIEVEPLRRIVRNVMTRRLPGAYAFLIPRSLSFDGFVRQELERGATQLVILGAGYDSRAYRFADLLARNGGRAFEVDAPPTSLRKRAKVIEVFGALPEHVRYVAVDFDREHMRTPLDAAGYDPKARTVFLWEGVTFYIGAAAVDDVLSFVKSESAPGSGIIFDYVFASVVDGTSNAFGARQTFDYLRSRGEPFTFGLDPSSVESFLAERGFALEEHLLPDEMERRFVGDFAREEVFKVAGFYGIVNARTL